LFALTALTAACASDDDPLPAAEGELGAECDFGAVNPCNNGLSCVEGEGGDGICAISLGQPCGAGSSEVENGGCGLGADCVVRDALVPALIAPSTGGSIGGGGEPVCTLKEAALCNPRDPQCGDGFICTLTSIDEFRCFGRVEIRGIVDGASDGIPIAGAVVRALDEEGGPVTDVVLSAADGSYVLEVPVVRNGEDGTPIETTFTLSSSAEGYYPYPSEVAVSPPIQAADAVREGDVYVIQTTLTNIALLPL
jgi:hypothetical protein